MMRIVDLPVPESPNGKEVLIPGERADWRGWLAANPDRSEGAWLVYRKRSSDLEGPTYDDLVEEALCFGWIDSVTRRVDEDRMIQWFSPRRPGGLWSALNKERIERLERDGLMTAPGRSVIDRAKADGSWSQTDQVDALVIPSDLEAAFDNTPEARAAYERLPNAAKKQLLWAIYSAKRPETRARRLADVILQLS
jgi:uncharacterized protein YdeI (YjbR/CyaY-like superfamily)